MSLTEHQGRAPPIADDIESVRKAPSGAVDRDGVGARCEEAGAEPMNAARTVFADNPPADPSLWTAVSGKASRFLARHVPTKSLRKINPQPLVSFTFDDVPASACREGAAILEAHGVRATYYVCAGGRGAASPCGRLASADDIAALASRGHEIGCHTYSHRAVSTLGRPELAGGISTATGRRSAPSAPGTASAISPFRMATCPSAPSVIWSCGSIPAGPSVPD
jgi:hypothetical protein